MSRSIKLSLFFLTVMGVFFGFELRDGPRTDFDEDKTEREILRRYHDKDPRVIKHENASLWWDNVPASITETSLNHQSQSNIHPDDYAGPESCKVCHEKNYKAWSVHPHRWMNALADTSTVKGDFSGDASISYLGGIGTFYREGEEHRMRLDRKRDNVRRVYAITQTIGSRFYQYYVGRQLEGPEPDSHDFYKTDHVLPFGYWLDAEEWVPVVHVGDEGELPDGIRADPFAMNTIEFHPYATRCNYCHTTFPLGDMFIRDAALVSEYAPAPVHFSMPGYLAESHPSVWDGTKYPSDLTDNAVAHVVQEVHDFEAPGHAVTLGISCEACHLGSKEHVQHKLTPPEFLPRSPHLFLEAKEHELDSGRNHANVNWVCSRCHTGTRPQLAGGMSTWNSTEFSDAAKGSCYSQLQCITCHSPHEAIGPRWSPSPQKDDAICLKCHQQLEPAEARLAHTHHPLDSDGSRCMNCHMPRINEGLQDVVRTHMIYKPTQHAMIEANHPNACNLCHIERSIDWTLNYLKDWYGATYSESQLNQSYTNRDQAVGIGWLKHEDQSVRLIAADALSRQQATWATGDLIDALDDPYLLNRQFTRKSLETMLDIRLSDYGYRFYMTPEERRAPLSRMKKALLPSPTK
ncbi:MAG: hypothetical protein ABGZ53_09810 [Fuerstiella sp.]